MKKLLLGFSLLLLSCGIPSYKYLDPPDVLTVGNGQFYETKFRNNTENDPGVFKGYRLYYRFYRTEGAVNTIRRRIEGTDFGGAQRLKRTGFKELYIENRYALIIDSNHKQKKIEVFIDFTDDVYSQGEDFNSFLTVSLNGNEISRYTICRRISQTRINENQTKEISRSFNPQDFTEDDSDIPESTNNDFQFGDDLHMALFAVAFGWDDNVIPVYSKPVFLGTFKFKTNSH